MPVPPPTLPSATGPDAALSRAANAWFCFTWKPLMSLSEPSDRKSTRLNSSHLGISYAVFCLKKKKHTHQLQSVRHEVCGHLVEEQHERQVLEERLYVLAIRSKMRLDGSVLDTDNDPEKDDAQ